MKLIKYEHACFTVEKNSQILVVDPGNYSTDFIPPENVIGVVVTHKHPDHLDLEILAQILAKNDEVLILGPSDVIDKIEIENKKQVMPGDTLSVGPFDLEFFGGIHAVIHESIPRVENLGVMINGCVYYPGDSLDAPTKPVDVLALPIAAPWLKIGEAMDFLNVIRPRMAFPTHDAVASNSGKAVADHILGAHARMLAIEYRRLEEEFEV